MAEIKKISTELQLLDKFLDTSGSAGSSGSVLTSTSTGTSWVSAGTPGTGVYLPLAGGTMTGVTQFNDHTQHGDQVLAKWGASNDLTIQHNGTNSSIANTVGNLYISNHADDKDIIFESDNGTGASVSYLTLDGSTTHAYFSNPGNVGIGTTNPRDTLEIEGNMRFVEGEDHLMIKPNSNIHGADFIVGDGVAATDTPVMSLNGLYGGQVTIQTQGNTIADKTVLDVQGTQGQLFSVTDDLSGDIFSVADISGVPIMNVNSDGTSYFDGDVGIGTNSTGALLDVDGDIRADRFVDRGNPSSYFMDLAGTSKTNHLKVNSTFGSINFSPTNYGYVLEQSTTKANPVTFRFDNDRYRIYSSNGEALTVLRNKKVGIIQTNPTHNLDVTGDGRFTSTVTATNFILSSDERLKENVEKICDNIVEVDWKTFELKTEKGQKRYGVIAQELEKTNPEFVIEDSQGFKSVAYIDLLIAKIAELEARLEKLEK